MVLKFPAPAEQGQPLYRGEEGVGLGESDRTAGGRNHGLQLAQLPHRRASSMVPHAKEAHHRYPRLPTQGLIRPEVRQCRGQPLPFPAKGTVGFPNAEGGYRAAVRAFPAEQGAGNVPVLVGAGAHKYVGFHAALAQELGQHAVVAEAIHVVAHLSHNAEFFAEVALGV